MTHASRTPRSLLLVIGAIVIAAASYALAPILRPTAAIRAAPAAISIDEPAGPAGLGGVPGGGEGSATADGRMPLAERATFWADRVKARPDDFLSLVQLALVDAERARLTADLDAYDQALALIDRSLEIVPAYPPTIRARASVRFAIHDFSGATADAISVLEKAPDDATALAVLGDSALELGRISDARAAYDRLAATGDGPWVDVRRARLAYVTGDAARAVRLAAHARAAAADEDPGNEGFYDYAHGEFARLSGDAETARHGYEAALAIRPTDLGALVGLARVEAATGDGAAAIATLRRAAAIAPQPETLALLGDLLAAKGDEAAADEQFATVRLTRTLSERAGAVYDRQLVAFELDHGGASDATLEAARASLADRPDAAGHDLVAWALHRLGRDEEAVGEIAAARAAGIVDARILFHAGAIALSRDDAAAETLLDAARALGPALDPRDAAELDLLLAP